MSYILDALRKSESERQQGRVPDFAQQVQLIHRPKRKSMPVMAWLALALLINAGVLAYVFWPGRSAVVAPVMAGATTELSSTAKSLDHEPTPVSRVSPPQQATANGGAQSTTHMTPTNTSQAANVRSEPASEPASVEQAISNELTVTERPTVIVPSPNRSASPASSQHLASDDEPRTRVPHLVELPLSFQRRVPDLIFNSHVYASDPMARRVMINDHYLRVGQGFDGIRVERITEDGVELSMNGTRFRVGVVRDWKSPR